MTKEKQKIIKGWAILLPSTGEPFTDLGLDEKGPMGRCRRFIIPETKSGAEAIIKINNLQGCGYKIVKVEIKIL